MEYYFRQKDELFGNTTSVSMRFNTEFIEDAVIKYREFLLGCGFDKELVDSYVPHPSDEEGEEEPTSKEFPEGEGE